MVSVKLFLPVFLVCIAHVHCKSRDFNSDSRTLEDESSSEEKVKNSEVIHGNDSDVIHKKVQKIADLKIRYTVDEINSSEFERAGELVKQGKALVGNLAPLGNYLRAFASDNSKPELSIGRNELRLRVLAYTLRSTGYSIDSGRKVEFLTDVTTKQVVGVNIPVWGEDILPQKLTLRIDAVELACNEIAEVRSKLADYTARAETSVEGAQTAPSDLETKANDLEKSANQNLGIHETGTPSRLKSGIEVFFRNVFPTFSYLFSDVKNSKYATQAKRLFTQATLDIVENQIALNKLFEARAKAVRAGIRYSNPLFSTKSLEAAAAQRKSMLGKSSIDRLLQLEKQEYEGRLARHTLERSMKYETEKLAELKKYLSSNEILEARKTVSKNGDPLLNDEKLAIEIGNKKALQSIDARLSLIQKKIVPQIQAAKNKQLSSLREISAELDKIAKDKNLSEAQKEAVGLSREKIVEKIRVLEGTK